MLGARVCKKIALSLYDLMTGSYIAHLYRVRFSFSGFYNSQFFWRISKLFLRFVTRRRRLGESREKRNETKTFIALPKCWLHTRRIEKGLQCAVLWKIFVGCFSNILVVSCKIFRHGIEKFKKPTRSTRFEYECWFSGNELLGKVEFIILRSCAVPGII